MHTAFVAQAHAGGRVSRRWGSATPIVLAGALSLVLSGCAGAADGAGAAEQAGVPEHSSITVFAAASLAAPFADIITEFEKRNPDVTVELTTAGSSDLATQIVEGAPADVFASASTATMRSVTDAGLTSVAPVRFARNALTIIVQGGNPRDVQGLVDLTDEGTTLVLCATQVPCGAAASAVLGAAGLSWPGSTTANSGPAVNVVSEESSVTGVLGKVSAGEADAGLVYLTDAASAADEVTSVEFAESTAGVTDYEIAPITQRSSGSAEAAAARQFAEFVQGATAQAVLADALFLAADGEPAASGAGK